jgi:hypothetical protein
MEKIIQARSYGQTPGRVAASRRTGCSILAWVQRDFFPDVPSLKLAKEISIASRAGDNAKLRELHVTPHCRGATHNVSFRSPSHVAPLPCRVSSPVVFSTTCCKTVRHGARQHTLLQMHYAVLFQPIPGPRSFLHSIGFHCVVTLGSPPARRRWAVPAAPLAGKAFSSAAQSQ